MVFNQLKTDANKCLLKAKILRSGLRNHL